MDSPKSTSKHPERKGVGLDVDRLKEELDDFKSAEDRLLDEVPTVSNDDS